MTFKYDGGKLAKIVRTKRLIDNKMSIRTAASQIGISIATLSRIENGKNPEVEVLAAVCHWVSMPMDEFFSSNKKK